MSTRYVGSFQGSTSQELIDAAKDFGAQGRYLPISLKRNRTVQTPMIVTCKTVCRVRFSALGGISRL